MPGTLSFQITNNNVIPFQRIQDYVDTRVLRPPHRNKARQASLRPVQEKPATRRLHDVPVLNLRAPLRQHGKRPSAHKAREIVPPAIRPRRHTLHHRQAIRLDRTVLRQKDR